MTVTWTQLGLSSSSATYRATDLWSGQALGQFTGYTRPLLLFSSSVDCRLTPSSVAPPPETRQFTAKNLAPHAVQFIVLDPRV